MRRRTRVLVAAGIAVAVVAAMPAVLGRLAGQRLSAALGAPVTVGSLAWNPFTGRWVASDVRVRGASGATTLRVHRASVRAFLGDVVRGPERRVREVVLERPSLTLQAAGDGWAVDLPAMPATEAAEAAWPALRLDGVALRHGVIALPGDGGRTIVRVKRARFHGDSRPSGVQGHLQADGRLGAASVAVRGAVRAGEASHRVRLHLTANDVPLASTLSLAHVDSGRQLDGRVALQGVYDDAAHGTHRHRTFRGRLTAADLSVGAGGERGVRLARVVVSRFRLEPERQAIAVEDVQAGPGDVRVRWLPDGLAVPGLLAPGGAGDAPGATWAVSVAGLTARDVVVHEMDGDDERFGATIDDLRAGPYDASGGPVPLAFSAELATGGRLRGTGDLATSPLTLRATVEAEAVSLAPLTEAARLPLRLESGHAAGTLDVAVDAAGVRVAGTAVLEDLKTLSPDPARPEHVLACKRIEVSIERAELQPLRASFGRLVVEWPYVFVDRTSEGVFPLALVRGSNPPTGDTPMVQIEDLSVTGGRIDFRDETLTPPYWRSLAGTTARARDVAIAPTRIAQISLDALVDELSPLHLEGTIGARTRLRVEAKQLALPPFNAYLQGLSSLAVASGIAEISSEIVIERSALEATNRVVLSRLGVRGGGRDDQLQQQVGLPLTLAIALMKDYRGNIALALPVGGDLTSPTFSLRSAILQAIVQAVRGAVLSPLNALGRVFLRDGRVDRFTVEPVPFPAGSRELDRAGTERLAQVGRVLQTRPDLALEVRGAVARADVERLQEAAALAALGTDRSAGDIRAHLRARLAGEPAPTLDAADQRRLTTLVTGLPWPALAARQLAVDRANAVAASLAVDYGLGGERVLVMKPDAPAPDAVGEAPAAVLTLRER